jgi:hypothetical protein
MMTRQSLNRVRGLSAALVTLLMVSIHGVAFAAEDADSTVNAMSRAYQQSRVPMRNGDLQREAETFFVEFFRHRSSSSIDSLNALESLYAEDVEHRGMQVRREVVMDELRRSFEQWPERSYEVRLRTLLVGCFEPTNAVKFPTCEAGAIVDWMASSGERHAYGVALYDLQIIVRANGPKIFSQNAGNLSQNSGPRPPVPLPVP